MSFNHLFEGREVIDGHLHVRGWQDPETGESFLHGVEIYRERFGFRALNLAALPSAYRDVNNNIMCAFYKLANENTYAHGGLTYPSYPVDVVNTNGMDPLTQYNELMEIGFDGIKMLEGKPSVYKWVQVPLCDPYYAAFFAAAEKDKTHILAHINDPAEFWDPAKATKENIEKGWYYGGGEHIHYNDMYAQIDRLLEAHPELHLTLAHFYFRSESPEVLEEMFRKYKNVGVDLTPGGEMYVGFRKRPEYFRDFFIRYADRIQFGTDGECPACMPPMEWLCDRIYRYIATDDEVESWGGGKTKGIHLPDEVVNKILCGNFVRHVGEKPREINKKALKAYIEKYKHLIRNPSDLANVEEYTKKML